MAPPRWQRLARRGIPASPYVRALLATAFAFAASLIADPVVDDAPDLLFLAAVAVTGWSAGLRPALLASVVGALLLDYFFELPQHSLGLTSPQTLLDAAAFLFIAMLIGSLNARLQAARRRAESARAAAEDAVRARDEALTAVSHDLRTPVTAIIASASALDGDSTPLPDETRRRLLGNILVEAEHLEHLVTDALALGRLEAGVPPRLHAADVGEIVSATLDKSTSLLAGRRITFDVSDNLPAVRCDPALVHQAVANLLDNVAVHTPAGSPVDIRGHADGTWLYLEISDAGPGVPPDARERIFHKFERLGHGRRGVGLGLALARAAAETQGGTLSVSDSASGGARFVLTLPLDAPTAAGAA